MRVVLGRGIKALAQEKQNAFPGGVNMKPEQSEIARLVRKVAMLKMDWILVKNDAASHPLV